MSFFTRLRDNLIGWPALERTPLGVLSPTAGLDAALQRWVTSFWDGVHDASPSGNQTTPAQAPPDSGGVGSPPEADDTSGGEPQPIDTYGGMPVYADGVVWGRRLGQGASGGTGSNLKVDKFGDVYEDPASPPDPDAHLTIAEIFVRIDELSEQFDKLLVENETIRREHARTASELRQSVTQLHIAREQRDQYRDQLGITHP